MAGKACFVGQTRADVTNSMDAAAPVRKIDSLRVDVSDKCDGEEGSWGGNVEFGSAS